MSGSECFRLAEIFSEGMIFQRDLPVAVYGEALSDCEIKAFFEGPVSPSPLAPSADAVGQRFSKGPFKLILPPQPAGRGFALTVKAGEQTQRISDIYIGEVFVAGGQSNMAMSLRDTAEYKENGHISANEDIRFFTVGRNIAMTPDELGEGYAWAYNRSFLWEGCNERNAPNFSAAAYHFARKLYEKNRIPIGIISCNVGGSNISGWMPEDSLLERSGLRHILACYENVVRAKDEKAHLAELHEYLDGVKRDFYTEENLKLWNGEMPGIYLESPGKFCYKSPCRLYHTMMEKIIDFTARGMIWYQGESEAMGKTSALYKELMEAFVGNLKAHSPNPRYAFHFVQLAPWRDDNVWEWEAICNVQREFFLENPGYGMVTIGDSEAGNDIHPPRKKMVGDRLACAALNCTYDIPHEFTGPVAVKAELLGCRRMAAGDKDDREICIRFIHNSVMRFEGEKGDFELEYDDGRAEKAEAEIRDSMVYIKVSGEKNPAYVRYGWCSYPRIGLFNESGIPASVFRLAIGQANPVH